MPVRIDLHKKTIGVSPGVLLGQASRRIGLDRGGGFERLWIGQAVHRRVLDQALATIPGYETERVVKVSFPVDDFTATFEGRLDGRFVEEGRIVVDEVKSLHFDRDLAKLPGSPRLDRFLLQLRWYLYAVASMEKRSVSGRLVLADIETGATRLMNVSFDPEEVIADLVGRIRAVLESYLSLGALAEAKAAEADSLSFPFDRYRSGQKEMVAAVERAMRQGEHLLVEAPTGIGKTAAALFPMVRAALRDSRRLFVLTAKTTQQEIFRKTLQAIEGDSFRSIRLRAKEHMCANDVILCHEDHCAYARDYGAKLEKSGLLDRLVARERHLEPDVVFEAARQETVCPFEVSLELADRADFVIGDYNYVFDPIVALRPARDPEALSDSLLLIDEAHNLVDRGRGYYSPELSERMLAELASRIEGLPGPTSAEALDANAALRRFVLDATEGLETETQEESVALVTLDAGRLDDLRLELESLLVRHLAELRDGSHRVPDDPIVDQYFTFARFHDVSRLASPGGKPDTAFDVIGSRADGTPRLLILCKDPAKLLAPTINSAASTVAMSATLAPPEFYRDLMGFDPERTALMRLPSPFPRQNRAIVVSRDVDTRYGSRARAAPKLAELVAGVTTECPGNVLALFPSYKFLDAVRTHLPPLPGRRILRPSDRSSELERNAALSMLRGGGSPVLLLAVSGGAFAEGVDYPGDMLQAVIVVSPALPMFHFEQERMKQYFEERHEKGFEYAYVVPGMTRVVQSAGRLIRSETDVGVIVLACQRFLREPYRRYLPPDWYDQFPEELSEQSAVAVTRDFFARVKSGELPVRALVPAKEVH